MSGEFKAKGVNVMLGPVISPMGRMLLDGRTWEGEAYQARMSVSPAC